MLSRMTLIQTRLLWIESRKRLPTACKELLAKKTPTGDINLREMLRQVFQNTPNGINIGRKWTLRAASTKKTTGDAPSNYCRKPVRLLYNVLKFLHGSR